MPAASGPVLNFMDFPSFVNASDSGLASGESSLPFQPSGNVPVPLTALSASLCVVGGALGAVACAGFGAAFGVGFSCAEAMVNVVNATTRAAVIVLRMRRLLVLVGRGGLPLQPFVHPSDDVLQPLDSVPRLSRPVQLMGFAREANHDRRYLPVFERPEHHFSAFARRRAIVRVAEDEHQRRREI